MLILLLACHGADPTPPPSGTLFPTAHTAAVPTADTGPGTGHTGGSPSTADTSPTVSTGHTGLITPTADTGTGTVVATLGAMCPEESQRGLIFLEQSFGSLIVSGTVFDAPDPQLGPPTITHGDCRYHTFDSSSCGGCAAGETCGFGSVCAPERQRIQGATLTVTSGADSQSFVSDPYGNLWGPLSFGTPASAFSLTLDLNGTLIEVPAMVPASGALPNAKVTIDADFASPGPLVATWDPPVDGGMVGSIIPVNHHVGGPIFTECFAQGATGIFEATEPMIDPLALVTGLEFQGMLHLAVASAQTPDGCVDFWVGTRVNVFP